MALLILAILCLTYVSAQEAGTGELSPARCPPDYRTRVETCIMEAQVAPQAGGGVSLITNKDRLEDLCDRGLLRKTIDCLLELTVRCAHNASILQDLDRLYSVARWEKGAELLCSSSELFHNNFECLSRSGPAVTTCIIMRTQIFRKEVTSADQENHARLREITCSFAESIVKCIWKPVARGCPEELMSKMVEALKHFLPPTCLLENITDNDDDYPIDYLTDFSMDYFDGTEATDGVEYTTEP